VIVPAQRRSTESLEAEMPIRYPNAGEDVDPGMAFAMRGEADPRDSSSVRPYMDPQERIELYQALDDGARAAVAYYSRERNH
jgi:hypothetical protein